MLQLWCITDLLVRTEYYKGQERLPEKYTKKHPIVKISLIKQRKLNFFTCFRCFSHEKSLPYVP